MVVDRHLNQLYPFMNLETQCPQEMIPSLNKAMMGNRVKNEQPLFTFLLLLFVHPLFNIKTLGFKRILYNQSISSSQKIWGLINSYLIWSSSLDFIELIWLKKFILFLVNVLSNSAFTIIYHHYTIGYPPYGRVYPYYS